MAGLVEVPRGAFETEMYVYLRHAMSTTSEKLPNPPCVRADCVSSPVAAR